MRSFEKRMMADVEAVVDNGGRFELRMLKSWSWRLLAVLRVLVCAGLLWMWLMGGQSRLRLVF